MKKMRKTGCRGRAGASSSEEEERAMYELTGSVLKENGYLHYEISNYAKPGRECRHNLGYWQRKDYLGFGLGAPLS